MVLNRAQPPIQVQNAVVRIFIMRQKHRRISYFIGATEPPKRDGLFELGCLVLSEICTVISWITRHTYEMEWQDSSRGKKKRRRRRRKRHTSNHGRFNIPRNNSIRSNKHTLQRLGRLSRQRSRKPKDPSLGSRVRNGTSPGLQRQQRRHVDDAFRGRWGVC